VRDLPELNTITFRVRGETLERLPLEAESLDAASARLPPGAYTVFHTYERRKLLHLDDHIARLVCSARELDLRARFAFNHTDLARALGQALDLTGWAESRLRLTLAVPGGELFVSLQPFTPLAPELFERGAAVAVLPFIAHETQAKATVSILPLHGARARLPSWAHEGVMVDETGCILEGLSSNFFAVQGGVLHTANENIVKGTTRTLVLELAAMVLPVVWEPVRVDALPQVDECFITSVSREVLPVVRIDQQIIGRGVPGAITLELLRRFREHVRVCAETV
jgi:branched-chain amino acid aminotransferase